MLLALADMPWMGVVNSCLAPPQPLMIPHPSNVPPVAVTATSTAVTLMNPTPPPLTFCHHQQQQVPAQTPARLQAQTQTQTRLNITSQLPHQLLALTTRLRPTCCWLSALASLHRLMMIIILIIIIIPSTTLLSIKRLLQIHQIMGRRDQEQSLRKSRKKKCYLLLKGSAGR